MSWVLTIPLCPEEADRLASRDKLNHEGQGVCNQYDIDCPADAVESWGNFLWEDAKVQQDNGDLGHGNGGLVHERGVEKML